MRVVQDSEDEDDLELVVASNAPKGRDTSLDDPSQPNEGHSTGSTNSLKRTIEAAHRAHFLSPVDASSSGHPHAPSSVSLPEHASKRRKTSLEASAAESPKVSSSSKKKSITYGKSRSIFSHCTLEERLNETAAEPAAPSPDKPWDLEGTMKDQWQYHEPGMFGEPSSTVPNATATQQLLQEVMAPTFLGIDPESDAPRYEPSKSSVPWSEYLKSSYRGTPDQSKPTDHSQLTPEQQQDLMVEGDSVGGGVVLEASPVITTTSQWSQRGRRKSMLQLTGSPLRSEVLQNIVDPKGTMAPPALPALPAQELPNETGLNGSATPTHTKRKPTVSPITPVEPQESPRRRRQRSHQAIIASPPTTVQQSSSSMLNSQDDLMTIGLPMEQYRPRPSRSRSLKLTSEVPVDYSIRPEKTACKPRRTRTSAAIEHGSATTTPEKIQQICDMGFTPSATQKALSQNNGDITSTVDWLIANGGTDEDELAPLKASKSNRKKTSEKRSVSARTDRTFHPEAATMDVRQRPVSTTTSIETALVLNVGSASTDHHVKPPTVSTPSKSPKVSVVIPRSGAQMSLSKVNVTHQRSATSPTKHNLIEGPRSEAKRRKTTMDQPDALLEEPSDVALVASEPTKEKKKRGRPKKDARSAKPASERLVDELQSESKGTDTALQQIQLNTIAAMERNTTPAVVSSAETCTVAFQQVTPSTEDIAKEHSQTLQKSSKPGNPAQITQDKGKTPYRVGLSKRARIAPLLRSVKK